MVFLPFNTLLLALTAPLANQGVSPLSSTLSARPLSPLGASSLPLRIMPLGASITYGQASSDGNGYRASLRSQLSASYGANPINMVGSRQAGTMRDNDVEGWPGNRIEQVHAKAMAAVSVPGLKPNVVLINAGTNDATQNFNVSAAGARMEALIRDVYAASPRAVVVLSTLLVNSKAEANVQSINRQFGDVARRLRDQERRKLVLVDMHGDDGPGLGDLVDGTHPNDAGYRKMANLWYRGLLVASDAGWLQAPEPVQGLPDDGETKRRGRRGWVA